MEIYHVWRTHRLLRGELARIRNVDQRPPWMDPVQRDEVERCYERLVLLSAELLDVLDDSVVQD